MSEIGAGTVLAGTYELKSRIGRGGMGSVWAAKHLRLPKQVAIKILHVMPDEDSVAFARFRREAEISSRLGHPNIVEIFDFNVHESGAPYIVMELLGGRSLKSVIGGGPVPFGRAIPILRQIATALNAAHLEGVIHRDLKPENVFLTPRESGVAGPDDHVTVLDFGISKILGSQSVETRANAMIGTPQYMSPEQAAGDGAQVGPAADQFALGALAYELLSGSPAFSGGHVAAVVYKVIHQAARPLSSLVPGLPEAVVRAVHRAMEKHPADRFESLSAFCEALSGTPLVTVDSWSDPPEDEADQLGAADTIGSDPEHTLDELPVADETFSGAPLPPIGEPDGARRPWTWVALLTLAAVGLALLPWSRWVGDESTSNQQAPPVVSAPSDATPSPPERTADPPPAPAPAPALVAAFAAHERPRSRPPAPPETAYERRRPTAPPGDRRRKPGSQLPDVVKADLAAARQALAAGRWKQALHLAKRSNRKRKTGSAASIIVRAYCGLRDLGSARSWLFGLSRGERKRVVSFCSARGLDLR